MSWRDSLIRMLGGDVATVPTPESAPDAAPIVNAQPPVPAQSISRGSDYWNAFTGDAPGALQPLTESSAFTQSAIYACIDLISGVTSAMQRNIFARLPDGERRQLFDDDLHWILNEQFHPRWPASAGWEFITASKLLHGDGFAEIVRSRRGSIEGLIPIHPLRVRVGTWEDRSRNVYVIDPDIATGETGYRVLDQDDILHVPGFGYNGLRSISPLRYQLRGAGSEARAAQEYSARFFENQARPDYALIAERKMDQKQVDDLRDQIDERHRGNANSHRPMILHGGLDVKTLSIPAKDMELVASRRFQIEEIARIYGVPPFLIGHTEKVSAWGTGMAEMGGNFLRYSLRKHLTAFQNEINRKFFRTPAKVIEFDTFSVESGDLKSLFEAFRMALGRAGEPGFLTKNEVRRRINMPAMDGGDTLNDGATDAKPASQPAGA